MKLQLKRLLVTKDYQPGDDPHIRRVNRLLRATCPLGIIGHLALAGFLGGSLELWAVATYQLIAALCYVVFQFLFLQKKVNPALFLIYLFFVYVEVMGGVSLQVYSLGWESGSYLWFFLLAVVIFSGYQWRLWFKLLTVVITFIVLIIMGFFIRGLPTADRLPQSQIDLMFLSNVILVFLVNAVIAILLIRTAEKTEESAFKAHKETRSLLLNILPEVIANRLASSPGLIADRFRNTSILFSDLVDFTKLSSEKSAEQIVTLLNEIVQGFDTIVEATGLEKIKTIGDGYMAAAGIPTEKNNHAILAIYCGAKMLQFISKYNEKNNTKIGLRIGINSGPLVAGVIGKNKFSYDLWGDTVNMASRMESQGLPGKIQISENTFNLVKDFCKATPRESMEIKGKGFMKTYIVTRVHIPSMLVRRTRQGIAMLDKENASPRVEAK